MRRFTFGAGLLVFSVAAMAQQSAVTPPATLGISAFAAQAVIKDPQLSPKGDRYAGELFVKGAKYLAIVSAFAGGPAPIYVGVGEQNELQDYQWINEDWIVVRVAATTKILGEDYRARRAYGVSASDGKLVPIAHTKAAQEGADILWIARDGTPRILLAIQQAVYSNEEKFFAEVFEVDVSTGRMTSRVKPQTGVMDWYADGNGVVRMGMAFDRDKDKTLFRTIDRANTRENEQLLVPQLLPTDSGKAIATSDSEGFDAVYELDLATMALGNKLFSIPGYDASRVVVDPTGTKLIGVAYVDTRPRVKWFDAEMEALQADLDKAVGADARAIITSMNRDQRKIIVNVESANNPGRYYYFDRDRGAMTLLAHVNSEIKGVQLNPVSTIRYKARDGLDISAVLTTPKGSAGKNLPLIVMPHGGPAARDLETWDWWAQYLAQMGYVVVQPNYRGSTGFGKVFYEKGVGQWGLAMQDDLLDAIDHLAGQGMIDPKRVCIAGGSYGGYAALRAAQRDGSRYLCAISFAGVSDIAAIMRYDSRFLYGRSYRDHTKSGAPDFKKVSPLNFPKEFSIPVLLVHGAKDLTVPVAQSRLMHKALEKEGKPVQYLEQPMADHHFSRVEDRTQFLQEMTKFLHQHNPL
jgi:dipeptidyl aminopeptidase/acylaminoacyl peptidase